MSYPPKGYDETGSPLMTGQSSTFAENPLATEIEEKEEEELNAVRRYEDFTTVGKLVPMICGSKSWYLDWIQDSLHERNVRAKGPIRRNPMFAKLDQLDGFFGYIWRLISQVLEEGESWVVLVLVGRSYPTTSFLRRILTA
jgi:chloride channel 3/4/5